MGFFEWVLRTALSWGITIGVFWLICLCFRWEYSLRIATGIWLSLELITAHMEGMTYA